MSLWRWQYFYLTVYNLELKKKRSLLWASNTIDAKLEYCWVKHTVLYCFILIRVDNYVRANKKLAIIPIPIAITYNNFILSLTFFRKQLSIYTIFRVDKNLHVKIADNSLSRDLFPNDYFCMADQESKPVKWMALESLLYNQYSAASDVVSVNEINQKEYSKMLKPVNSLKLLNYSSM